MNTEHRNLTFDEAIALAFDDEKRDGLSEAELMALSDLLAGHALRVARALDKVHNIDPRACRGQPPRFGTPNKKSYTYKVRKALGYSYP